MRQNMPSPSTRQHAKFAASSSHRWLECPASISLSEKMPPQPESKYALEGTRAHEVLDEILKSKIEKTAPKFEDYHTDEMRMHANAAAHWIFERAGKNTVLRDLRVNYNSSGEAFGTLDAAIIEPFGSLVIIDYKYGAGQFVEVKDNAQLIFYAIALLNEYSPEAYEFTNVELVIIQPRAADSDGESVRTHTITFDEIAHWMDLFSTKMGEANSKTPAYKSGEHCRWCPGKPACPEISVVALKKAQIEFDIVGDKPSYPSPDKFEPARLGKILDAFKSLETWMEAVKEHADFMLRSGAKIPGWKLVEKRSTRKWIDEKKASQEAKMQFGNIAFSQPELLSPAQFEKAVGDKDWVKVRVSNISSGSTMVSDTDNRPEIKSALDVFNNLDEEKPSTKKARAKTTKQ